MEHSGQLGQEKIPQLLLRFSIPAIIGMLANVIYGVVDQIYIGNYVGPLGIAAITVSFPASGVIMTCSMLVAIGGSSLTSIKLGQNDKHEAEQILGNVFTLLLFITIVFVGVGYFYLEPILILFGASETLLPLATEYLRIILIGCIFMVFGFGLNDFINAEGNPKYSMYTVIIGVVINLILDPIFIIYLNMGLKGAAIATVIAQTISTCWVLRYFLSGKSTLKLHMKNLKLKWSVVTGILALGATPFLIHIAGSFVQILMNNNLKNHGGDIALSAMGICLNMKMIVMMFISGIIQGAQPIIGFNYGAKLFNRVRKTFTLTAISATIITTTGFLVIMLFTENLIRIFNRTDRQLLETGALTLRTFLMFLPLVGLQMVGSNYFRSVGKPKEAMILGLSRQVLLLIPLLIILPRYFGYMGILYAGPAADLGAFLITAIKVFYEMKLLKDPEGTPGEITTEISPSEITHEKNDNELSQPEAT